MRIREFIEGGKTCESDTYAAVANVGHYNLRMTSADNSMDRAYLGYIQRKMVTRVMRFSKDVLPETDWFVVAYFPGDEQHTREVTGFVLLKESLFIKETGPSGHTPVIPTKAFEYRARVCWIGQPDSDYIEGARDFRPPYTGMLLRGAHSTRSRADELAYTICKKIASDMSLDAEDIKLLKKGAGFDLAENALLVALQALKTEDKENTTQ